MDLLANNMKKDASTTLEPEIQVPSEDDESSTSRSSSTFSGALPDQKPQDSRAHNPNRPNRAIPPPFPASYSRSGPSYPSMTGYYPNYYGVTSPAYYQPGYGYQAVIPTPTYAQPATYDPNLHVSQPAAPYPPDPNYTASQPLNSFIRVSRPATKLDQDCTAKSSSQKQSDLEELLSLTKELVKTKTMNAEIERNVSVHGDESSPTSRGSEGSLRKGAIAEVAMPTSQGKSWWDVSDVHSRSEDVFRGGLSDRGHVSDTTTPVSSREEREYWHADNEHLSKRADVYVNLTDPFGRTFKIPYRNCTTWEVSLIFITFYSGVCLNRLRTCKLIYKMSFRSFRTLRGILSGHKPAAMILYLTRARLFYRVLGAR